MAKKSYQVDKDFSITPNDNSPLEKYPVYISAEEGEGYIRVSLMGSDETNIAESQKRWFNQGILRPIQVKKVWAADTTATGIIGSYDSNAGV